MSNTIPRLPISTPQTVTGRGDTTTDAWGVPKVTQSYSLLHGIFTFNVPAGVWKESLNGSELTAFAKATSVAGKLELTSGSTLNDTANLATLRHPRYEANRGHLYSISAFLPAPAAAGRRDFGLFTAESGVFFRLKADGLYACKRTTIATVTSVVEEKIEYLPSGIDLANGNIYDIQMQWRGVGNVLFFVGDPVTGVSKLVHRMRLLAAEPELTLFNPALPIAFECENLGDEVKINSGCVDVSSEGGKGYDGTYGTIATATDSGSIAVTGFNPLVYAVRSLNTVGGLINTRDTLNLGAYAYSDQRSLLRVWQTRDATAITDGTQSWLPFRDGHLEYVEFDPGAGTPATFDTAKANLIYSCRVNIDSTLHVNAVFSKAASVVLSPGDILVFTIHRETGAAANVGLTHEFSEEI